MCKDLKPIGVLRSVRSEYGKQIRKQYEQGELKVSRHSFMRKEIRDDGVANTLDSVQKDNLLAVSTGTFELAVKVKEATKQGYAVARGGKIRSTLQCQEVKQEEGESG